jgi:hypothetical protein
MSLEDTIRGLTDAVNALNETLRANREALLGAAPAPAPEKEAPAPKPPKAPKPSAKPEAPTTTAPPAVSSDAAITPTHIDYAAVSKAITDTFPKDREKVLSALKKFGAAKGPQLKPEDYAAFLAELA